MYLTKILMLLITTSLCLAFSAPNLNAQRSCGTDAHQQELIQHPEYKQWFEKTLKEIRNRVNSGTAKSSSGGLVIPVAIHFDDAIGASMTCMVDASEAQIETLNADFNAANGDIQDYINISNMCSNFPMSALFSGIDVEFAIATYNHPSGYGLSNGDYAITVGEGFSDHAGCEWAGYLNIFVEHGYPDQGGDIGLADVFGALQNDGNGVQIRSDVFGGDGIGGSCNGVNINSNPDFNLGRTGSHEVGHYFGLEHTFFGTSCSGPGDGMGDTPQLNEPNYGAPWFDQTLCRGVGAFHCNTADFYMNYMDYTNDVVMVMFTVEQATRMCETLDMTTWRTDVFGGAATTTIPFELGNVSTTAASCIGDQDGTATIKVDGGVLGFSFNLTYTNTSTPGGGTGTYTSDGELEILLTDLAPGIYTYTITNGSCTDEGTFVINAIDLVSEVITEHSSSCTANDGYVIIDVQGGDFDFDYNFSYVNATGDVSGGDTYTVDDFFSITVTDLPPGTYTYSIENDGCTIGGTFIIGTESFTETVVTVAAGCIGNDGAAIFTIMDGDPNFPFEVSWGNGSVNENGTFNSGIFQLTNLSPGIWDYVIQNDQCIVEGTFEIELDEFEVSLQTFPSTCVGENGTVIFTVLNGDPSLVIDITWENMTGPGSSDGTFTDNIIELNDLAPGSWDYVLDNGVCRATGTFVIGAELMTSIVTSGATCNSNNGTADITISGGYPNPNLDFEVTYVNGPFSGFDTYSSSTGTVVADLSDLAPGVWTYTIVMDDCSTTGTFEIEQLDSPGEDGTCEDFNSIWAVQGMANANGYWTTTMVSSVNALIKVEFGAATIPDGIRVTIDYATGGSYTKYWTAGYHKCDGYDEDEGEPTGDYVCKFFSVSPCDVVTFEVFTDICELDPNSAWNLNVYCGKGLDLHSCGPHGEGKIKLPAAELLYAEKLGLNSGYLKIFPNPVKDIINIINHDAEVNYQAVRILDISGKTLLTADLSNRSKLEIDISALQSGMYLVEIIDDNSNKVVEKILKVD